jgi:hypothetical protein
MYKSKYKKASAKIAQRNKTRKIFSLFLKASLPTAILIGLVFLARADFLQVKSFDVVGVQALSQDQIKNVAASFISGNKFFFIPKSNIFLINKDKLATVLMAKFGRLENVDVGKEFLGGKIDIKVQERTSDFLWCMSAQAGSPQDQCYFMDSNGLIFEKSDFVPMQGKSLSVIFRGILQGDPLKQNFATPDKMKNYVDLIGTLEAAKFDVNSINIESTDKGVTKTSVGDIVFDPQDQNLTLTAQNVIVLINDIKSKNPDVLFNYIDARFGTKIYYKLF